MESNVIPMGPLPSMTIMLAGPTSIPSIPLNIPGLGNAGGSSEAMASGMSLPRLGMLSDPRLPMSGAGLMKRLWFHEADYSISPESTMEDHLFAEPDAIPDKSINKRSSKKHHDSSQKDSSSHHHTSDNTGDPTPVQAVNIAQNNAAGSSVVPNLPLPGGMDFSSPIKMAAGSLYAASASRDSLSKSFNSVASKAFPNDLGADAGAVANSPSKRREPAFGTSHSRSSHDRRHSLELSTQPLLPNEDDDPDHPMTQEGLDENREMGVINWDSNAKLDDDPLESDATQPLEPAAGGVPLVPAPEDNLKPTSGGVPTTRHS